MSALIYILAYLAIAVFLIAVIAKFVSYLKNPIHVRWELYPVVYEGGGRVRPDRLNRKAHAAYRGYAEQMLAAYRDGVGHERAELHRRVAAVFRPEPDVDPRRVRAFCKLLDEASTFDRDLDGEAARTRLLVFSLAARHHPLSRSPREEGAPDEARVKQRIARRLGRTWEELERALYRDVFVCQRLSTAPSYPGPEALLARYNVAQVQCAFYGAERVRLWADADLKGILRLVKLSRLLHEIRREGFGRYRIDVTGPTAILRRTPHYGARMACMIPALLACRGWRLQATILTPWRTRARLDLSPADGLASGHAPPPDYDSALEERFARRFGAHREGWTLVREGTVLHDGQTAFFPDFTLRHDDGREVALEIVGFWTPEYLAHKCATLSRFAEHEVLVAAPERHAEKLATLPGDVIWYKSALRPEAVLAALGSAQPASAPPRGAQGLAQE